MAENAASAESRNRNAMGKRDAGRPRTIRGLARRYPALYRRAVIALFQELRPRHDVGVFLKQCPALTFGQAAPDAVFDLVVQGVCRALLHDGAVPADNCGFALCGSPNEEFVGISAPTERFCDPRAVAFAY